MVQFIKEIEFYGNVLKIVKMEDSDAVYVLLNDVCRALRVNYFHLLPELKSSPILKRALKLVYVPSYQSELKKEMALDANYLPTFLRTLIVGQRKQVVSSKLAESISEAVAEVQNMFNDYPCVLFPEEHQAIANF